MNIRDTLFYRHIMVLDFEYEKKITYYCTKKLGKKGHSNAFLKNSH